MTEIIPSPGTDNKEWKDVESKINAVKYLAKTIHIDVIDGKFAQNTTFLDPTPFAKFTKDLFFEVHLMVEEPINYLESFAQAGFRRFIGQIEKMSDQTAFVAKGQMFGEVGLALDKPSSMETIKVALEDLDCLLVMTIPAGFSGQTFEPELLDKVSSLRKKTTLPLEVDGGINFQTIEQAKKAGANRFVVTSYLFSMGDPAIQFNKLVSAVAS